MIKKIELAISPSQINDVPAQQILIAEQFGFSENQIMGWVIDKKSIDARGQYTKIRLSGHVFINEAPPVDRAPAVHREYPIVSGERQVIIIGAGPAGLFAALRLIERGIKPIIIERGKRVAERRRDIALLNREGRLNSESNYCFGEGGAGTYSDGKLYTRSTKRGDVKQVLETFVFFGADAQIMLDARPHIGTNKLPQIIIAMREAILRAGGEVHFEEKVTDLHFTKGKVDGVSTQNGKAFNADHVILATGHSSRDIFGLLRQKNISIEPKPFALGVRIEHPQTLINKIQYHKSYCDPFLPAAYYQLAEQVDGRGAFSFCMCPGGIIAPCATAENEVVVNGWSPSKRNNPFANSGLVVQVEMDDVAIGLSDPLRPLFMLDFQREIEKRAMEAGGGAMVAPAQRMVDFVNNKVSSDLPECSYIPGLASALLSDVLPDFIFKRLQKALPAFEKKMKGYYTNEAVLVGVESRTSSPVRIPRKPDTLEHPQVKGFYPCGEGAGYAGGILSAALDGIACANAVG